MPLDWLVVRRAVAIVPVADELAAGHFAEQSGAVVAVAAAAAVVVDAADAELQLVVAHCVELEPLELASEPVVVVLVAVRARVPAIVHFDEFAAGLVVGGELD